MSESSGNIQIIFEAQPDGSYHGRVLIKLVERDGDPRHGLTENEFAFMQALQEANRDGSTMTIEDNGRKYTGVRITDLVLKG